MQIKGTGKFAANRIITDDGIIINGIVELNNDIVVDYYAFDEEQPFTQWLGGTIKLLREEGNVVAHVLR